MNLKEIKELVKLIDDSNLTEFQFIDGDKTLLLKKQSHEVRVVTEVPVVQAAALPAQQMPSAAPLMQAAPAEEVKEDLHIIASPIVGVYYDAPTPDSPAFATKGSQIKSGQVLCIIEAMKLMNEITSDVNGEVVEVLAESGSPVEYGQPLFKIRKA